MVEVKNITKKYGARTAIEGITFSMEPGRVYGLLGPNGAGKSTTMNIMTGYIAPSEGEVSVDGFDIYEDAIAAKSRIGYLPENPPLYQDMTVHEYLMFVAELKGVKRQERYVAVESAMEDAGILDVQDQLIRTLSKGYRQRVGFAGAVVNDPEVIILDEPTVGLDPKQIIEFRELIRQLGEEHVVLLSSHILSEISEVCDHVFIINEGKLIVDDDVENLDRYAHESTRIYITTKGQYDVAEEALLALDGVKSVEPEGEDGLMVMIEGSSEAMTEKISMALMESKIPILGMQVEKDSLEQIFLDVTEKTEEAAAEGPDVISWEGEEGEGPTEPATEDGETRPVAADEATEGSETRPVTIDEATEPNAADGTPDPGMTEDALAEERAESKEATGPSEASTLEEVFSENEIPKAVASMEEKDSSDDVGGMMDALFDEDKKEGGRP